jgi:hypothetical protein
MEHDREQQGKRFTFCTRRLVLATCIAALTGCGAQVERADDDEFVADEVAALGFDADEIEVDGDVIRVDGDIILFREQVLNGEYAPVEHASDSIIEKGYRTPTVVGNAVKVNIKLAWPPVGDARRPTDTIRNAFINAAGDYNSIAGSTLRISQNNTGAANTIIMRPAFAWPAGTLCKASEPACAVWPSNGNPGHTIYIKDSAVSSSCNWTTSSLALVARHEFAHTLGIMHVKEVGSTHIPNTKSCAGTPATCADTPGYSTVVKKTIVLDASCKTTPTVLQTDDRASIDALY